MLKHYLLITFRSITKSKSNLFINILGLSTGLACVLLIYLWVNDELNFDKFHKNNDQLYQILVNHHNADQIVTKDGTPDLLAETLKNEMPEVELATAVMPTNLIGKFVISSDDKKIKEYGQFTGEDFFKVFSFKLIKGNANHVLSDKRSIVISEKLSQKLFNTTENVIGKTLEWQFLNFNEPVIVSGVFENIPTNSSLQFDFVLSFEAWKNFSTKIGRQIAWYNFAPYTYVVLKNGSNSEEFNKKLKEFLKQKNQNTNASLFARQYSSGYLYGNYENGAQSGGRIYYVKMFSLIAIFILIIACINFMNLSTATASTRLKEVGIKKTIGSDRTKLIVQFIGESVLITLISLLVTILLVFLLLPEFNSLTGKEISINFNVNTILSLIVFTMIIGLISGSYPAFYLSKLSPLQILKGGTEKSSRETIIRKGLVIFQFTLSVIFIVGVLIVYKQIKFIQTQNPGFQKNNLIYFDKEGKASENQYTFLEEIKKIPGVINASIIGSTVVGSQNSTGSISWKGKNPENVTFFEEVAVDYNMLETLGIELKEGRSFDEKFGSEKSKIIFNEAAIRLMDLKDPIGKTVRHYSGEMEIIDVVKDFHFESMHEVIKPLLFKIAPEFTSKFMIRIKPGSVNETIKEISSFYGRFNPGYPFEYKFLEEDYQNQYKAEKRVELLSKYFAGFAIIISCLGLFGLASFTAEKRIKEIGVRKALGADSKDIIILLSKDFIKLVFISVIIASPFAYYFMNNWLQDFAYRIEIEWWMFTLSAGIVLLIALTTVSYHSIKAALANPVQSLRYE